MSVLSNKSANGYCVWWRAIGGAVVMVSLLTFSSAQPVEGAAKRSLDCDTALNAGVIACEVSESWIAGSQFPDVKRFPWPPEGYLLRDRALLVSPDEEVFCVLPFRALQRERDAVYSERDDRLPRLHEGFPWCRDDQVLRPEDPEYRAIVYTLREVLPTPDVSVRPGGNTIIGMHTVIDWVNRPQPFRTTSFVQLARETIAVEIHADVVTYFQWNQSGETTGPHDSGLYQENPWFVYRSSGDEQIHVIDMWTVRVQADGIKPFHDVVYVVHAPVDVRVNELVIRVDRSA